MVPQITIVGGGSTHWTPRLLVDFANSEPLKDARVTLVDIDESSLPVMEKVAEHIASIRRSELSVSTTTLLEEGLADADFVIVALSVGGFASMRYDIEIPARYGVRQPVGDSVGPGGIFRALRTVPVVVEIARAVQRVCPEAWLINVSNPLTALCLAASRESEVKTVGLCNELVGLGFSLSLLFDAPMHAIKPVSAGVNHLPLVTSLSVDGADGFALLREVLHQPQALAGQPIWMPPVDGMHWKKVSPGAEWTKADVIANNRVKFELFERFGVLPGASDTHVVEFFPGFVTAASDYGRDWGVHHYGLAGHKADKGDDDASMAALLESNEISRWPSGELVAPLLSSLASGSPHDLPVNLPNSGQVTNLDEGVVVECIGTADGSGLRPRDVATVTSVLSEYLRQITTSQKLTVDAALSGNRTTVLEAMLTDQLVGHLPYLDVVAMTDEMLAATAPWLSSFS